MQQEEILLRGEATKTIIKYFTTFSGQTSDDNSIYYLITDINNNPLKLSQSIIETNFGLDFSNYNIPLSSITAGYKIYTGSVIQNEIISPIDANQKAYISQDYLERIKFEVNQNQIPLSDVFSYVFFEETSYNDYFLNIKINRSLGVLNTLNIYNVPVNDAPVFNNNTGVLFGKLEAIQVLSDENGNKLKIPIKNAVVAIFNPSDEVPSVGSVDSDGNRIQLSLFENLKTVNNTYDLKSYGSFQSYLTDVEFSTNDFVNETIPKKYKYSTITNEFGEFVLHNVPVGQQTLMVEVDLLKQGLEPEEVALNFFPYPTNEDPNISTVPHLYFNQFPVNILPSWGDFQTGYTQIDLSVALDLRKWITYFTYPISSRVGNSSTITNQTGTNSTPKVLEELFAAGNTNFFKVSIRDMTKPFIIDAPPKIELVKIIDIYDKNFDLKCAWNQEFKIKANKVEFNTTNYNAFKVPANLYDHDGRNTNGEKGVWLGAYQIKASFPDEFVSFQATGFAENWPTDDQGDVKYVTANHYDLNRYDNGVNKWYDGTNSPAPGSGIGIFPYQKPWSLKYPEPYRITKIPSITNPLKSWNSDGTPNLNPSVTNRNGVTNNFPLTEKEHFIQPRFVDGDLVGGPDAWATNANGYGLQNFSQTWAGNDFAREVTKNEVWRYEEVDWWAEEWSNGFNSVLTPYDLNKYPDSYDWAGKPAISGEKWQRLEAGYAYWLKPRAWPRIKNEAWGDHLLDNDYAPLANHDKDFVYNGYYSYFPAIHQYLDENTLIIGNRAEWFSKFGRLNIYRVEKPYYNNPKKPPFTEQFARFNLGTIIMDQSKVGEDDKKVCKPAGSRFGGSKCTNSGYDDNANSFIWLELGGFNADPSNNHIQECNVQFCTVDATGQQSRIRIVNIGSTKVNVNGQELIPGNWSKGVEFKFSNNGSILLPANDKYNPTKNQYDGASYLFYIETLGTPRGYSSIYGGAVQPIYRYKVGVEGAEKNYYLTSFIPREVGLGSSKCKAVQDYNTPAGVSIAGVGGFFNLAIGGFLIWAFPVTAALVQIFIPKEIKQQIFTTLRNIFSSDQYKYNSNWRKENNLGVFINGFGYYVPGAVNYSNAYFNNRLRGYMLPYIGDDVSIAANTDFRGFVPYNNNWFNGDFKRRIGEGAQISVFQPSKVFANNLKGTGNMPYYMEGIVDQNGTTLLFDYAKGF